MTTEAFHLDAPAPAAPGHPSRGRVAADVHPARARESLAGAAGSGRRVLFVGFSVYSREGGIERFNRRVVRALAGRAPEGGPAARVAVLSAWDRPEHAAAAPPGVRFAAGGRSKLRTVRKFVSLLLEFRPTTICFGHVLLTPLAVIARALCPGARRVLFVHGIDVWSPAPAAARWVVNHAIDRVASVSRFTAGRMAEAYHTPPGRFRILPNAVDLHAADLHTTDAGVGGPDAPAPADLPPLHGRHRVLTVGRLAETETGKNVDTVIRALPEVLRRFPDTHHYVIGEGALRPKLEALAAGLGVAENVHFLGGVPDRVKDFLCANSHVFALPSSKEGFGIVFLEAWRHGLPVVCGNRDASPEVVRDGVDGFCVDPDPAAVAEALCRLLGDGALRERLGASGRRRLEEQYGHAQFTERLAEVLGVWPEPR